MIARCGVLIYAAGAYALAMLNILYIIGFLADFGVPKGINDGPATPAWLAIPLDAGLVLLFGLHHSVTARRSFKAWWTRLVPPSLERATYLYMTAAMTALLVILWRPVPHTLWQVDDNLWASVIIGVYLAVWLMMFAATFHFGHLQFFGLRQALDRIRGAKPATGGLSQRWLYSLMRHPISLGWMITPWLTPHMTAGQLTFAIAAAAYVLVATPFEEADLIAELGDDYRSYRAQVPAFVPGFKRSAPAPQPEVEA